MFQFSHYVDQNYPWKKSSQPEPTDDSVLETKSTHIFARPFKYKDAKLPEPILIQIADTRQRSVGAQRERDFYYNKLKDIETLCRILQENRDGDTDNVSENILSIIYQTQEIGKPIKDETTRRRKKNRRKQTVHQLEPAIMTHEMPFGKT